ILPLVRSSARYTVPMPPCPRGWQNLYLVNQSVLSLVTGARASRGSPVYPKKIDTNDLIPTAAAPQRCINPEGKGLENLRLTYIRMACYVTPISPQNTSYPSGTRRPGGSSHESCHNLDRGESRQTP